MDNNYPNQPEQNNVPTDTTETAQPGYSAPVSAPAPVAPVYNAPVSAPTPAAPVYNAPVSTPAPAAPVYNAPVSTPAPAAPVYNAPMSTPAPAAPVYNAPMSTPAPAAPVYNAPMSTPRPAAPVYNAPMSTPAPTAPVYNAPMSTPAPTAPVYNAPMSTPAPTAPVYNVPSQTPAAPYGTGERVSAPMPAYGAQTATQDQPAYGAPQDPYYQAPYGTQQPGYDMPAVPKKKSKAGLIALSIILLAAILLGGFVAFYQFSPWGKTRRAETYIANGEYTKAIDELDGLTDAKAVALTEYSHFVLYINAFYCPEPTDQASAQEVVAKYDEIHAQINKINLAEYTAYLPIAATEKITELVSLNNLAIEISSSAKDEALADLGFFEVFSYIKTYASTNKFTLNGINDQLNVVDASFSTINTVFESYFNVSFETASSLDDGMNSIFLDSGSCYSALTELRNDTLIYVASGEVTANDIIVYTAGVPSFLRNAPYDTDYSNVGVYIENAITVLAMYHTFLSEV